MNKIIENSKLNELFGAPFELLDTGFGTGLENMDFDMERTVKCSSGEAKPMFRLYGWKPWAVSLGANQKESDIDKDECARRGFDIVRRPTGGRAVLHADELTYSVVMKLPHGMTVHDVYREIHVVLLEGLRLLGCEELDFEKSQPDFRNLYKESAMSVSCFAASARYEIAWKNRKLIGSAQRLFGDTLLQHGSILIGEGHEQIAAVTNTCSEDVKNTLLKYIMSHSSTLNEACGRTISYGECVTALTRKICA